VQSLWPVSILLLFVVFSSAPDALSKSNRAPGRKTSVVRSTEACLLIAMLGVTECSSNRSILRVVRDS